MRWRSTLLLLALVLAPLAATDQAYACIRVARATAGTPSSPEVSLPVGYALVGGDGRTVAAPGEWHAFITGPRGTAHVGISWPGTPIAAVIQKRAYLALVGDAANGQVSCEVAVDATSVQTAWTTLDVATYLDESDLAMRMDHNHPARRSGWYADNPWPDAQARAAVNWEFAARLVLRDWGLHHEVARAGVGSLSILGFESVNPLHIDFPPHWHLIDYWPGQAGTPVPHYYMDGRGALTRDKIQVLDRQDQQSDQWLDPGQPFVYTDPDGATRFASEIRADGGLDLGPAPGQWRYSIVAGDDGTFLAAVSVLRDGALLASVSATDDVAEGVLTVRVRSAEGTAQPDEVHLYDPLTGQPRGAATPEAAPAYGFADPEAIPGVAHASSGSGSGSRCGMGGAIAALLAALLLRVGWLRSAVSLIGGGAAAGWRAASTRMRAWSGRLRSLEGR